MELAGSLEGTAPDWAACSGGWDLAGNFPIDQTEAVDKPETQLLNLKTTKNALTELKIQTPCRRGHYELPSNIPLFYSSSTCVYEYQLKVSMPYLKQ